MNGIELLTYIGYATIFIQILSLDMESIDALAKAVNEFEGGMVLVSHDMRLISQVANEIWICDHKRITKYDGDIQSFKMVIFYSLYSLCTGRLQLLLHQLSHQLPMKSF